MKTFILANAMKLLGGLSIVMLLYIGVLHFQKAGLKRHVASIEMQLKAEKLSHENRKLTYERAAEKARADDAANQVRVERQQSHISQETSREYQTKLADLRRRFERLRSGEAPGDQGGSGSEAVPRFPDGTAGPSPASQEDRLPPEDALIASEQALQLQALINWVLGQQGVDR